MVQTRLRSIHSDQRQPYTRRSLSAVPAPSLPIPGLWRGLKARPSVELLEPIQHLAQARRQRRSISVKSKPKSFAYLMANGSAMRRLQVRRVVSSRCRHQDPLRSIPMRRKRISPPGMLCLGWRRQERRQLVTDAWLASLICEAPLRNSPMQNLFRFRLKNLSKGMAAAKEAPTVP